MELNIRFPGCAAALSLSPTSHSVLAGHEARPPLSPTQSIACEKQDLGQPWEAVAQVQEVTLSTSRDSHSLLVRINHYPGTFSYWCSVDKWKLILRAAQHTDCRGRLEDYSRTKEAINNIPGQKIIPPSQ